MASEILFDYLSPAECAAELGIAARTLDRWVGLGEAPPQTKVGRRVLYRKQAVAVWVRAREQTAA